MLTTAIAEVFSNLVEAEVQKKSSFIIPVSWFYQLAFVLLPCKMSGFSKLFLLMFREIEKAIAKVFIFLKTVFTFILSVPFKIFKNLIGSIKIDKDILSNTIDLIL